jgi:NAD+ kinase
MKKIGIRRNENKVTKAEYDELAGWLRAQGVEVADIKSLSRGLPKGLDLLVVMGGDGTLLGGARAAATVGVPVIGVDFGGLGFLSEIKFKESHKALSRFLEGKYRIEKRMMLEADINRAGKCVGKTMHAVNDVVITKNSGRMLRLKVFINDEYLTEYPGDGVIVATATGSTAYSLSAGGPIVSPDLDVIVLTSICPHTLFERSIITKPDDTIRVELPKNRGDVILIIDGQEEFALPPGGVITVRRGPMPVLYARVKPSRFLKTMREKFHLR